MDALLKEYPLIISTFAFIFGVLKKDAGWFLAFVWSFISMYANRGMKTLSIMAVEKNPDLKAILYRPGSDDRPGMPSGHAQISAAFFVFMATWLMLKKHDVPISKSMQTTGLAAIAIISFMVMNSRYRAGDGTKLHFVVGAIIGGLFGLVPYFNLRLMPWTKDKWLPLPGNGWATALIVLMPMIVWVIGSTIADLLGFGQKTVKQKPFDLETERSDMSVENVDDGDVNEDIDSD